MLVMTDVLGAVVGRNDRPFNNRANLLGNVFGRVVTHIAPLRFVALKLITLRRRVERSRSMESVIA
jgi:hypothetical protein